MVRVAWQSETDVSSSLIPINPSSDLSPTESVELLFNTWELTAVTLPGYLVCLVFPSSAYLIVSFYRLFLGTLYPAYSSYKAIRNKDVDEYVKWMMYWVVFALFTTAETITDVFLGFWFPFYYEIKIIVVLWLLSPATEGSSILYRKFVHPVLVKREKEIDEYLLRAKEESYKTVLELGTKGVQYASRVIMQTAINGGGGLMNTLRKSYSVGDVSNDINIVNRRRVGGGAVLQELDETDRARTKNHLQSQADPVPSLDESDTEEFDDLCDEMMEIAEEQQDIAMRPPVQKAPRSRVTREVYFTEIDSGSSVPRRGGDEAERYIGEIRSVEDVSSGYSSTEFLPTDTVSGTIEAVIRRAGSVRSSSRSRPVTMVDTHTKTTRSGRGSGSDVPSYATLPRSVKKTTVKPK
ncbi:receptor expression-enhancing protein 2-like isoform X2 [Daphnia pulicaria]|uniref:receptor expression-enhancing protein 2-like isoform X2 n=1 Tax=Daphnia pulicaria TaxID=35523 RepID=UPI001EEA7C46|nr:receptor expression-enhancing protein 2-like isoform X2 [Daphnia pulicaria]